ncbi:MAG: hypothetical protein WC527_08080 [Candidatus Margulisiibacteriota bacterium]
MGFKVGDTAEVPDSAIVRCPELPDETVEYLTQRSEDCSGPKFTPSTTPYLETGYYDRTHGDLEGPSIVLVGSITTSHDTDTTA